MNLDDILELAAARTPSTMERARTRRAGQRVLADYSRAVAEGRDLVGDLDVEDALAPGADEAIRIARVAQSAKLGTVTWIAASGSLSWSDQMSLTCGYAPGTAQVSPSLLARAVHPDDAVEAKEAVERVWHQQTPAELTFRLVRADNSMRYLHTLIELLTDDAGAPRGIIATAQDVTNAELARRERDRLRRRREIGAAKPPERDPITRLLTRERFIDEVDTSARSGRGVLLAVAVEPMVRTSVLAEDEMDRVIGTAATVLGTTVGRAATCGLVGYGEFGIMLPDASMDEARLTGASVVRSLREQLTLTPSSGVRLLAWGGLVPFTMQDRTTGLDLLVDAGSAWQRGRRSNDDLTVLPGPLEPAAREQVARTEILTTIAADRLCLYAQPIRDLTLNEITRHEILLRVLGPANRPQPPAAFLEVAERVDEILAVDRWVIDHGLALISQGPQTSHHQINLSGRSLSRPGLLRHVREALDRTGVDPATITFEITESAVIDNLTAAIEFADGIQRIGCKLALDDFGTGYASLSTLKYLPIDLVKIDGEFITGLRRSSLNKAVVRAVVGLCRELGIRTAAEFVPDDETIDLLRDYGVDHAQGYAIGRPVPMASTHAAAGVPMPLLDRATG